MNYLISYDLREDKLRLKVAKFLLRNACTRIQKSLYVAPNYGTKEWHILLQELQLLLNGHLHLEDSLFIFSIPKQQLIDATRFANSAPLDQFLKEDFYFFFVKLFLYY